MAKTVTYDTLDLDGANVWVDQHTGALLMEVNFHLTDSVGGGPAITKHQEAQSLLSQAEQDEVVAITGRLQAALEAQELV